MNQTCSLRRRRRGALQFFHAGVVLSTRGRRAVAAALWLVTAVVAGVMFGAGCSFAPQPARPVVAQPVAFKELPPELFQETEGWKTATPQDDTMRGQWWELFQQPELSAFEEEASASNQSVAVALANFQAARAVVKQVRAQYLPTVTAGPAVTRAKTSAVHGAVPAVTTVTLPFDASWELDVWGRVQNAVQAATLESQASLAELENMRLTIQAEVAADYFQLRVLDSQKQLLDSAVQAYQESLRLTRVRHKTGVASDQDVAQAETQLNLARAQTTDLGIQRGQFEHALATLLGQPASSFSVATNSLTATPIAIPLGVPSQLLERRADIAAAERRVAEANAQIGVARAAFYPALTLSGAAGYQGTSLGNLLTGPNLFWSVGAALSETLFDAGKRDAVTEQARAVYRGTVANYRQTVLSAFQEVEDNLSTLRILSQELQEQNAVVDSSQRYLTLATNRYKLGIDNYLNVITAQTALLSAQRTAINLRLQQMVASVQLIKALGGGWTSTGLGAFGEDAPYHLLQEIPIGGEGGWDYLSVDASARRLYVTHASQVVVVDLDQNAVVGAITNTPGVHGFALAPDLQRGFASNGRENSVSIVDLKTLQTLAKVPTGETPDAILYEPGRREVYSFNGRGNSVTVFDATSTNVVATLALPGKPEFAVADPVVGRVYCNIEDRNEVLAIDTRTHQIVDIWPTKPGAEPAGLAFDPATHHLFVGCRNQLTVMMASTKGSVLGTVPIGQGVDANAFDPGTRLVFSSCGEGRVTIAREDPPGKLTVVQTLATERSARTLALDPKTHRIYLASAKFEPQPPTAPAAPRPRPKIIAGSMKLLVYGQTPFMAPQVCGAKILRAGSRAGSGWGARDRVCPPS